MGFLDIQLFFIIAGPSIYADSSSKCKSYDLENIKFKVVRFRDVPEYGMVRGLLSGFNLPEGYGGILCSACQHFAE